MIATMLGAMRVGLLPRWLGVLGIFSGLFFLPIFGAPTLQFVPTFWLVAMGILLMERWPNGDPPAWAAGEARPWPTQSGGAPSARKKRAAPGERGARRSQRRRAGGRSARADTRPGRLTS